MKSISTIEEFKKLINEHETVVCIVDSPWSGTSKASLQKLINSSQRNPSHQYLIIDNTSAHSFIYDWLKAQETKRWANSQNTIAPRTGSWIQGNGELIGVTNGALAWFEASTFEFSAEELKERLG